MVRMVTVSKIHHDNLYYSVLSRITLLVENKICFFKLLMTAITLVSAKELPVAFCLIKVTKTHCKLFDMELEYKSLTRLQ